MNRMKLQSNWGWMGAGAAAIALVGVAGMVSARSAEPLPGPAGAAKPAAAKPAKSPAELEKDVLKLADRIDVLINLKAAEAKIEPAPIADDAEFHRRAWLDIAGKIPTVSQTREFIADQKPDKRRKLVDRLLASPNYVAHFTDSWRSLLLPEANTTYEVKFLVPGFESWLRQKLAANASYAQMAREIVASKLDRNYNNGFIGFNNDAPASPSAFFTAKGGKPENLGASTAKAFLGVRIECAQCHNHPFARWKRDEFWSFAAFFGGVEKQGTEDNIFAGIREVVDRRELVIPGSDRGVQPAFLGGGEPDLKFNVTARLALADWMTAKENPFFARSGANRLWAWMFGIGLVDPVDDLNDQNPASHPELLDELAKEFANHEYDLKFLIQAITASKTYQRSSVPSTQSAGADEIRLFTHHAMKGMTGEQLYDSLAQAIGLSVEPRMNNPFFFGGNGGGRAEFVEKFSKTDEKPTEHDTSILQALALMNGNLIDNATKIEQTGTLSSLAEAPFLDTEGKVRALYLAALCREPRSEELDRMVEYVDRGGPTGHPKKALADVFWALLNSGEFMLNH